MGMKHSIFPAPRSFGRQQGLRHTVSCQGRQYLQDTPYPLPIDQEELDRMEQEHYLYQSVMKGNYMAPLHEQPPREILDVGTANGIWLLEMANEFPYSRCHGIDILPVYPKDILPSNCTFSQGDVLHRLPIADRSYQYVHQRFMAPAIRAEDWPHTLQELIRVTRPGGYIELMETDFRLQNPGPRGKKINEWASTLFRDGGRDPRLLANLRTYMRDAGLAHIHPRIIEVALGKAYGSIGELAARNCRRLFSGLRPHLTSAGWSDEELEQFWDEWMLELKEVRTTTRVIIVYAQRV